MFNDLPVNLKIFLLQIYVCEIKAILSPSHVLFGVSVLSSYPTPLNMLIGTVGHIESADSCSQVGELPFAQCLSGQPDRCCLESTS